MMLDHAADEGENYFATMTDMMVGLLFIFLIMVAFFAYKLSRQAEAEAVVPLSKHERVVEQRDKLLQQVETLEETVEQRGQRILELQALLDDLRQSSLAGYNEQIRDNRRQILTAVRESVKQDRPDLGLTIDFERGILRLQGVDLFASSSTTLLNPATVSLLANALRERLDCYIYSKHKTDACDDATGFVESVYVEGHTDSLPLAGFGRRDGISNNLQLSTRRASNTYETLVTAAPELIVYKNPADQSIMSVAGFGSQRPIANNSTRTGRARNRRIDIRIEMYSPRDEEEMQALLEHNAPDLPLPAPPPAQPVTRPQPQPVQQPAPPRRSGTVTWTEERPSGAPESGDDN